MDVEIREWQNLLKEASDKDKWKARVAKMKLTAQRTTKPAAQKAKQRALTKNRPGISTRFTFFPQKSKSVPTRKIGNPFAAARQQTMITTTMTQDNKIYTFVPAPHRSQQPQKPKAGKKSTYQLEERIMKNLYQEQPIWNKECDSSRQQPQNKNNNYKNRKQRSN